LPQKLVELTERIIPQRRPVAVAGLDVAVQRVVAGVECAQSIPPAASSQKLSGSCRLRRYRSA